MMIYSPGLEALQPNNENQMQIRKKNVTTLQGLTLTFITNNHKLNNKEKNKMK